MTDEDPWKGWYQPQQPSAGQSDDGTQDMTIRSPMPAPGGVGNGGQNPGSGQPGGGQHNAWPAQPPRSSSDGQPGGGRGAPYGSPAYGGPGSYGGPGAPGYAPGSPYPPGPGGPGGTPPGTPRQGRRWRFWGQPGRHGRRIALIAGLVVVVLIAGVFGSYFWIDGKLNRSVALPATANVSAGTNWLIAGTDTRVGISRTERATLHLGADGGGDSDSLMLLHTGTAGGSVLISIPRDSYVPIPGFGDNKINAALAFGGPALLVKTVEQYTGLKINHYMSIGFGGLADVVGKIGGVRICVKAAVPADPTGDSGFKGLAAGCHNLSGAQAIAFVRDRHSFATSDLQRIQDQRAFLAALLSKATSPGVYLNPFTALPFASTAASAIAVDKGTSLYDLIQVAMALRNPESGTVPVANPNFVTSNAGDAVQLDQAGAVELFNALKDGKAVPKGLLGGTEVG